MRFHLQGLTFNRDDFLNSSRLERRVHRATLVDIKLDVILLGFLEALSLDGHGVVADGQEGDGVLSFVACGDRAHDDLLILVGDRHRRTFDDSAGRVFDRAAERTCDLLRGGDTHACAEHECKNRQPKCDL